jgi:anionic cell wall polymer biosynthesis LytR-Cps2A-Psr (LCP) family protein
MSIKKILLIIILILIGLVAAFVIYQYEQPASTNMMKGQHNLLLLTVDPSEARPGLGGVDMAFAVNIVDGNIKNLTPIYPGGMMHPTAMEPAGAGTGRLMLHDTLWDADPAVGAKLAQETVQANTGIKTDGVVMVTPTAIDALIASVGPINVSGQGTVTGNSIQFLRAEQNNGGMSRGGAVESIMKPILNATKDPSKYATLSQIAVDQYLKGNIVVIPKSLFTQFAISKGINSIF